MNDDSAHPGDEGQADAADGAPVGVDADRFVVLFAQHHTRILAYILAFVHHRADADEIFQETSVVLWRKFDEFDTQRDFVPWAKAIAFNQVRSFRRRKARDRHWLSEALLDELATVEREMHDELSHRQRVMVGCVEKLRQQDRELLETYYGTTNPATWVAERVGRSVHAVYKAIKRIRRSLFDCIDRHMPAGGETT